jgi:hypothetical protein
MKPSRLLGTLSGDLRCRLNECYDTRCGNDSQHRNASCHKPWLSARELHQPSGKDGRHTPADEGPELLYDETPLARRRIGKSSEKKAARGPYMQAWPIESTSTYASHISSFCPVFISMKNEKAIRSCTRGASYVNGAAADTIRDGTKQREGDGNEDRVRDYILWDSAVYRVGNYDDRIDSKDRGLGGLCPKSKQYLTAMLVHHIHYWSGILSMLLPRLHK